MQDAPSGLSPAARRRSLVRSVLDGFCWSVMQGTGERFVGPFLVYAKTSLLGLGAVSAVPGLLGALAQWAGAAQSDRWGRRKAPVVGAVLLQALVWLVAIAAVYFEPETSFWIMLAFFTVYLVFANYSVPAWNSWMGDLVPPDHRGLYFGARNFVIGIGAVASFLAGGLWLDSMTARGGDASWLGLSGRNLGFLGLFAVALVARMASGGFLGLMAEPPYRPKAEDHFTLAQFLRRAPHGDFGRFAFYVAMLHLGVGFAGPYFGWYVLDHLKYTNTEYASVWIPHIIAYHACQPLWGRLADQFGNKIVMAVGGIGMAGIPALWLFSDALWWLATIQVYDGLVWAAFNIASGNYLFDIVTPPKRARCTAFLNLFMAVGGMIGIFAGAFIGMACEGRTSIAGIAISGPFTVLLAVSTVMRLLPSLLLLRTFKEVRVKRLPPVPAAPARPEPPAEVPRTPPRSAA